jgi:hypothetical protein
VRPRRALQIGCVTVAGVCACVAAAGFAPPDPALAVTEVCFEGRAVKFEGVPARGFTRWFRYGPWQYGVRGGESKPDDKNPNLYLLVPGPEHHSDAVPQFDHTAIVNTLAKQEEAHWDVYWAVVLDPELTRDIRDERDLLLEAQNEFSPAEQFDLHDVPGREVLTRHLKVETTLDLERFRKKDGRLPRLVIMPARVSVRGTITDPDATSPQQ